MAQPHVSGVQQVGLWPTTDQLPSYLIYDSPPEVLLRFAREWCVHLPATADSGAYLRRLAAVVATCADVVEEVVGLRC
jgi:hypothetical protein